MKIYTRTGDQGQTSLLGGGRVSKDDLRVAAYGDVDELNAALGAAMALEPADFERNLLESIQKDLLTIGGRLATPDPSRVPKTAAKTELKPERIQALEEAIDRSDEELAPLSAFILPGGTPKAAMLHLARTVCRRAERSVVALHRQAPVPETIIAYLNRLGDLLFTLARLVNRRSGVADRTW